jgi:putative transposase
VVTTAGRYDQSVSANKSIWPNTELTEKIREAFAASNETYGMPRIRAELLDAGVVASRKRIAHLIRQGQTRGVSRRRSFLCHH